MVSPRRLSPCRIKRDFDHMKGVFIHLLIGKFLKGTLIIVMEDLVRF